MIENQIDKSLLISALNSQHSFQSLELVQRLAKIPGFPSLEGNEKARVFEQEVQKASFEAYKTYNLKAFLKDVSCEVAMNLKKARNAGFYDDYWRLGHFLSLFFELRPCEIEEAGLFLPFECARERGLSSYLAFIIECADLVLENEVFDVAVQVHNLPNEMLSFLVEFETVRVRITVQESQRSLVEKIEGSTIEKLEGSSLIEKIEGPVIEKIKESTIEKIEESIEKIEGSIEKTLGLLFREARLRALYDVVIRGNTDNLLRILRFQRFQEVVLGVLEFAISKEISENSIILGFLLDPATRDELFEVFSSELALRDRLFRLFLRLSAFQPSLLIAISDLLLDLLKTSENQADFNGFSALLASHIQSFSAESPASLDLLLTFLERAGSKNPGVQPQLESLVYPAIFTALCQKTGVFDRFFSSERGFFRKVMRMAAQASVQALPVALSIVRLAFLAKNPEYQAAFLLGAADFTVFLSVIRSARSWEILEQVLECVEQVLKMRGIVLENSDFSLLTDELEKSLRSESLYSSSESSRKTLSRILLMALEKQGGLYSEVKKSRCFPSFLQIRENDGCFLRLRVFMMKRELEVFGDKNIRRFIEIMFSGVSPSSCVSEGIVQEIENFNRLEVLMNIVLAIRKLVKVEVFRGFLKEAKVLDNFLNIFAVLAEKQAFLKEWLGLFGLLVSNEEHVQEVLRKARFLRKRVYKRVKKTGPLDEEVGKTLLMIGIPKEPGKGKEFAVFGPTNPEESHSSQKIRDTVAAKTSKADFFRNFKIIEENLGLFMRKIIRKRAGKEKTRFLSEFLEFFEDEKLGILGTSLFPEILPILWGNIEDLALKSLESEENNEDLAEFRKPQGLQEGSPFRIEDICQEQRAIFKENIEVFLGILRANKYSVSGEKSGGFMVDFLFRVFQRAGKAGYSLDFFRTLAAELTQEKLEIKGFPLRKGQTLLFPKIAIKTLDFTLFLWVYLEKGFDFAGDFPLFSLLNFTAFRPELFIQISERGKLLVSSRTGRSELNFAFSEGRWAFLGLVFSSEAEFLKVSVFLDGLLIETCDLPADFASLSPMNNDEFAVSLGDPQSMGPGRPRNCLEIGPVLMLSCCLNPKEVAVFYLLNSMKGNISLDVTRPTMNWTLVSRGLLDQLELHVQPPEKSQGREGALRCFVPDFRTKTLLKFTLEDLAKTEARYSCCLEHSRTLETLEKIEQFSIFRIFLDLKRLLLENKRKDFLLTLGNSPDPEKCGLLLGYTSSDSAYLELLLKRRGVREILEESVFFEQALLDLRYTEDIGLFRGKLRFLLQLTSWSERIAGKLGDRIEEFKEVVRERKGWGEQGVMEDVFEVFVKRVGEDCQTILAPDLFKSTFLSTIFLDSLIPCSDPFKLLLPLIAKSNPFENINAGFLRTKDTVNSLTDVILLTNMENEAKSAVFTLLFEILADPPLSRLFLGVLADLSNSIKHEPNTQIAIEKTFRFLLEVFSRVENSAIKGTQKASVFSMMTPQYLAVFSRDFIEKMPFLNKTHYSLLKSLQKPMISLFMTSLLSENEEKSLKFEVSEDSLAFYTQNSDFFQKALSLLMKTEGFAMPSPQFTIEPNAFPRFLLVFRALVRESESIAKFIGIFEEKIEDFLEENPGFFEDKSPGLSELYSIFKPSIIGKKPEEKTSENRMVEVSAIILGEKSADHMKIAVLEEFIRKTEDFFLVNLLTLSSLVPFIEAFLGILLQSPGIHTETEDLLNRLAKSFCFLLLRLRQTPWILQKSETLLIELFVSRFLLSTRKPEEKLPIFEKNLAVIRETLSDSQFEGFSIRVLEHLAESTTSNDQFFMHLLRNTLSKAFACPRPSNFSWAVNVVLVRLRKLAKPGPNSLKNPRVLLQIQLEEYLKILLLKGFTVLVNEEVNEDRVENELNTLIFNADLVFSEGFINNTDFLYSMICMFYSLLGKPSQKIAEKALILFTLIPAKNLQEALTLNEIEVYNSLFALARQNSGLQAFFLEFAKPEVREKTDLVVYKKLWSFYLNFLNEQRIPRIETEASSPRAERKSTYPLAENPLKASKSALYLSFSEDNRPGKEAQRSRNCEDFGLRSEKSRFAIEKARKALLRLEKSIELRDFFLKNREGFPAEERPKSKERCEDFPRSLSFKLANNIGPGYRKCLLKMVQTPEEFTGKKPSPQRGSSEFSGSETNNTPNMDLESLFNSNANAEGEGKTAEFPCGLLIKNENLQKSEVLMDLPSKTEDLTLKKSVNLEGLRKSRTEENFPRLASQSPDLESTKALLHDFLGINEEVLDFFPIGILKGFRLIDSLILIGRTSLFLVENCPVIHPEKAHFLQRSSLDKSRWFLPRSSKASLLVPYLSKDCRVVQIAYGSLTEVHAKRYLLYPSAIELFYQRKSVFLVANQSEREVLLQKILDFPPNLKSSLSGLNSFFLRRTSQRKNSRFQFDIFTQETIAAVLPSLWASATISSFEYLQTLNLISGRTYADLSQYPVFPWVLADYVSERLDTAKTSIFRDLAKPVGALTVEKARSVKERFTYTLQEGLYPAFHHGSHYSSQTLVIYYLIRLLPFSLQGLELQGGKFDLSDRLFHSIEEAWELTLHHDVKELIPELFYFPEAFLNLNSLDLGQRQSSSKVEDLRLPPWSQENPRVFSLLMRKSLEKAGSLHSWIDLIWGVRQGGKPAIESLNRYFFLTYEGGIRGLERYSLGERNAFLQQINEYGQTPRQLFTSPHCEKRRLMKCRSFFYDSKSLRRMRKELVCQVANAGTGFRVQVLGGLPEFGGAVSGIRRVVDGIKGFHHEFDNDFEDNFGIIHENQTILRTGKNEEDYEILDFNEPRTLRIIRQNRVFQAFSVEFGEVCGGLAIPESGILVLTNKSGGMDFYGFERRVKKLELLNIGLIYEGPSGVFANSIEKTELFPAKKSNFIDSQLKTKRLSSLKPRKAMTSNLKKPTHENNFPKKKSLISQDKTPNYFADRAFFYRFRLKLRGVPVHRTRILLMGLSPGFGILITVDLESLICIWDYFSGKLLRVLQTRHFADSHLFYSIQTRDLASKSREPALSLSINEETGDFALASRSYLSVYSLNGVLLACERSDKARFSCCKLVQAAESCEEARVFSGDAMGTVRVWLLRVEGKLDRNRFSHYYRDTMLKSAGFKEKPMFFLECVWVFGGEGSEKGLEVLGIELSRDQQKMLVWHRNGEVNLWQPEEEEDKGKRCGVCGCGFGILDKKAVCGYCGLSLCMNCGKLEMMIPEVNMKKAVRVCEDCGKGVQSRTSLSLYDNY